MPNRAQIRYLINRLSFRSRGRATYVTSTKARSSPTSRTKLVPGHHVLSRSATLQPNRMARIQPEIPIDACFGSDQTVPAKRGAQVSTSSPTANAS